jgi:Spy/CpxP family protein refolding chaperone
MTRKPVALLALGLLAATTIAAAEYQPYAGLEQRTIKALSDQQFADLQAGRGMSLALAAELNGYPGPRHVLELAEPLGLSAEQRARTAALIEAMTREATAIGADVIRQEAALDRMFADRNASEDALRAVTADLGGRYGELRLTHLKYHLAMRDLLSPEQTARYQVLRGYAATAAPAGHDGHHHH